jgi:hypothetical protein
MVFDEPGLFYHFFLMIAITVLPSISVAVARFNPKAQYNSVV